MGVRLGEVIGQDMIAVPVSGDQRQMVVAALSYISPFRLMPILFGRAFAAFAALAGDRLRRWRRIAGNLRRWPRIRCRGKPQDHDE